MATKRKSHPAVNNSSNKKQGQASAAARTAKATPYSLERSGELVGGWLGWLGPILATILAAALRIPRLGIPKSLVFDETYYAKDSLSLLYYGYERATIPSPEPVIMQNAGKGPVNIFIDDPAFVVHPPVGKWLIALGEHLFGMTPFGWRIMVAVLAIATVLVTARVTRRLLNSNVAGTLAGLFLALDGLHIAMSRTALLDTILTFFVVCAFGFLIVDRELRDRGSENMRQAYYARGGFALMLGLSCATKWSGLYFTAAFLLLMVSWDIARRDEYRFKDRIRGWAKSDLLGTALIPVSVVVIYIFSWIGWFRSDNAWDRNWATQESSFKFIPSALRSLWHYHDEMLNFHTGLRQAHNYRANPWGWPILARPTSFFYESKPTCGATSCSQEVIPLGNQLIWWGGAIALIAIIVFAIRRQHRGALPILIGFAAGWVPWLPFAYRTTFQFYSVVYLPFTIMALVLCLQLLDRRFGYVRITRARGFMHFKDQTQDGWGGFAIASLLIVGILTYYFWPLFVAQSIPYSEWISKMWFKGWI
ncbi:MAG: phospholipid carrier-dependent glycosyltransferase [Actinobacteria bacterium]|nr:phospholipid carrier-dependent glycosyltransferase [Actinomycetota bacterium]NBY15824.1 phospholipid carrier-dependent glycosyltransferase [Actinomycetota bacterium]